MKHKENDKCVKELGNCYYKLYKRFCEGTFCTECVLDEQFEDCLLIRLQDLIDACEEKQ